MKITAFEADLVTCEYVAINVEKGDCFAYLSLDSAGRHVGVTMSRDALYDLHQHLSWIDWSDIEKERADISKSVSDSP